MSQDPARVEQAKRVAALAAAELVEDGMTLGLGTGTTVAHLLPALAGRDLDIRCVSTSPRTEEAARALGLRTESFSDVDRLDLAIDGADQVAPDFWLVKGGGAAHTREKLVAAAAARFVVIADSSKTVPAVTAPIPLELVPFGLRSTLLRLAPTRVRDVPRSPDGGIIADFQGEVGDPAELSVRLAGAPGVVDHGLFPPTMVSAVVIGHGTSAEWLERRP